MLRDRDDRLYYLVRRVVLPKAVIEENMQHHDLLCDSLLPVYGVLCDAADGSIQCNFMAELGGFHADYCAGDDAVSAAEHIQTNESIQRAVRYRFFLAICK